MNATLDPTSQRDERAVARKFIGRIQWEMILVGLGQFCVWLTVFILGIRGEVSLWIGFPIAALCCCFAYLPSHEGQHGNIAGRHRRFAWLNHLVGHVSLLPLAFPYRLARCTHLKHHAFTNDPERDTDHHYVAENWWRAALEAQRDPPREMIEKHALEDPLFAHDLFVGAIQRKLFSLAMLISVVLWPLPTFFLWWLPQKIGLSYLAIFFSHTPHRPGRATDRYRIARFWRTRVLPRFAVQSMTHHAVHHLYPRIPHWSQPEALIALEPFIDARQMEGAELLPHR